jgi:hypothetical protein
MRRQNGQIKIEQIRRFDFAGSADMKKGRTNAAPSTITQLSVALASLTPAFHLVASWFSLRTPVHEQMRRLLSVREVRPSASLEVRDRL